MFESFCTQQLNNIANSALIATILQPKTVNAFQRVKIDQVVFADDRLQNNSYWAKVMIASVYVFLLLHLFRRFLLLDLPRNNISFCPLKNLGRMVQKLAMVQKPKKF